MAWLEAHQELREHPKTKRAARLLNVSQPQMIGHMFCLWWWCLDYAETGSLANFDRADIADAAGWEGDPNLFIEALVNCGTAGRPGFLVDNGEGLSVNDWAEYGGRYITKRNQGRERQREWRLRNAKVTRDEGVSDAVVTHDDTISNALVTRHNSVSNAPTVEDSREQDRTVENRTGQKPEAAQAPSAGADKPTAPALPVSLPGWAERLKDSRNRPADLVLMFRTLYPQAVDVPDFGYIGKVANKVGGAGRLAELLWQHSAKPPSGDVLAYIQAQARAPARNGANDLDAQGEAHRRRMKALLGDDDGN